LLKQHDTKNCSFCFFPQQERQLWHQVVITFLKNLGFGMFFQTPAHVWISERLAGNQKIGLFALVEPVAQVPSKTMHDLEVIDFFFPHHKTAYLILRDHTISSAFVSFSLFS